MVHNGCYQMFYECNELQNNIPTKLPENFDDYAFGYMFFNNYKLSVAPELPATKLTTACYNRLFYGCTSLTNAPELPATKLTDFCYLDMFTNCTNLNNISVKFTSWKKNSTNNSDQTSNPSYGWLFNVALNGTFKCSAALPKEFGPDKIPEGWTVNTI